MSGCWAEHASILTLLAGVLALLVKAVIPRGKIPRTGDDVDSDRD